MPSLDQVLAPSASEQTTPLVQGELALRKGVPYARVNGSAALWGPLRGLPADTDAGSELLVGVSQTGDYWVVATDG
jgi:hypothetical protein